MAGEAAPGAGGAGRGAGAGGLWGALAEAGLWEAWARGARGLRARAVGGVGRGRRVRGPKHKHKRSDADALPLDSGLVLEGALPGLQRLRQRGSGRWGTSPLWLRALALVVGATLLNHLLLLRHVRRNPLILRPCERGHFGGTGGFAGRGAGAGGGAGGQLGGTASGGVGGGGGGVARADLDGVAFICTGIREGHGCNLPLMCDSLNLLRFSGGWEGQVWVITDVQAELRAICPTAAFEAVEAPEVSSVMEMKNFKRRLFEIIPGQPRAVLYIDSDILSVGCMDPFLATVGGADMAMFHDVYCPFGGCNEFCGGFIYMRDTPSTRQCIADWDAELRRDGYRFYRKDQDALDTVRRRGQCLGVRPYPYSMMQAVDAGFLYQMFDRYRLKRPIFQHFTHGIRQHQVWPSTYDAIERQLAELMPSAWSPPLGLQAERRRRQSAAGADAQARQP